MPLPVAARVLIAILLAAAGTMPTRAGEVQLPRASLRAATLADLAAEPNSGKSHNEFWTYQFWLNDGILVQLNLSRVHFGSLKDPVCGADLAVAGFQGRNFFVAREYPIKNFSWEPGEARLRVHKNIHSEGLPPRAHRVRFTTRKDGQEYFLDLTFDLMTPGAVWGDGIFRLDGGEQAALFINVPRARVRGRLGLGGDTIPVRGFGWMDHTRQTEVATRIMDAGYRYAVLSGRAEGGYFFQADESVFGYGIREEKGVMTLLTPTGFRASERANWGGMSVPKLLEIGLEGRSPMSLRRIDEAQRTSVLQELGRFERFGAKAFLGGEVLGYRGLAKVDDTLPAIYSFTLVKR